MDKKQPPDPGNWDLDTDTNDDKITAFEEVKLEVETGSRHPEIARCHGATGQVQAGQIFSSIFTCMCNYNTDICGMAMAQTVIPVW